MFISKRFFFYFMIDCSKKSFIIEKKNLFFSLSQLLSSQFVSNKVFSSCFNKVSETQSVLWLVHWPSALWLVNRLVNDTPLTITAIFTCSAVNIKNTFLPYKFESNSAPDNVCEREDRAESLQAQIKGFWNQCGRNSSSSPRRKHATKAALLYFL